jgi:ABC-type Fe3+-hydroxamate transport system substrate-binding protein
MSTVSDSLIGQLFSLFGLTDVVDNIDQAAVKNGQPQLQPNADGQVQLTGTQISHANPQLIFFGDATTPAPVYGRAGWSTISAVANRQVFPVKCGCAATWGTQIPALVGDIADGVHHNEVAPTPAATVTP